MKKKTSKYFYNKNCYLISISKVNEKDGVTTPELHFEVGCVAF